MQETFLHFAWRWRRFDGRQLSTTDGQPVEVIHPGHHNSHAGPDFFNARVRIGHTEWAGNVEIHLKSSDWLAHRHDQDAAYNNVILHVVWENDMTLTRADGQLLPCLVLGGRIPRQILDMYREWQSRQTWIPCMHQFAAVPDLVRRNWYDRLLIERLELRTAELEAQLAATGNHWEEAAYRMVARAFGLKVNTDPFEQLARSLPLNILARHKINLFQTEALIFGQSGWLSTEYADDYPRQLTREFRFLQHKYQLSPLLKAQWKLLRMRPSGFPTIRLAQFAALIHRSEHLFSNILEAETVKDIETLFSVAVSEYWQTHYVFDRPSKPRDKHLGRDAIQLIIINTLAPMLFLYGKLRHLPDLQDKTFRWLEALPPEDNAVISGWKALGAAPQHAADSQALLQLKTKYCDEKRCLDCHIGGSLLR